MKSPTSLVALALIGTLALAACTTPTPAPSPSPSISPSGSEGTPTPTPTVTAEPLVIPDCETLLPLESAKAAFSPYTEFSGELSVSEFQHPLAVSSEATVLATANPARACRWGIPKSDGIFALAVAAITADDAAALQGELAEAGFVPTASGTSTSFELEAPELGPGGAGVVHLFAGRIWIISDSTALQSANEVADSALEALRAANPTSDL